MAGEVGRGMAGERGGVACESGPERSMAARACVGSVVRVSEKRCGVAGVSLGEQGNRGEYRVGRGDLDIVRSVVEKMGEGISRGMSRSGRSKAFGLWEVLQSGEGMCRGEERVYLWRIS